MTFRPVLHSLGRLLLILAAAMLVPAIVAALYSEGGDALAFTLSAALTGAVGGVGMIVGDRGLQLFRRHGFLLVVGGWVLSSVFGAVPYVLSGSIPHPVDALFESASGFTTTGSTILIDIEALGRGMLFWRSFTQWLGGMGIIVLFVALLPELGSGARFLYRLEVPGPTAETWHPRVQETASVLWRIYLLLSAAEVLLLLLAGMDLYDAATHTFSTMSTGGFSPRAESVAAFTSPWVEIIVIVFMLFAGTNFSLYYGFRKLGPRGGVRELVRDREFQIYIGIIVIISLVAYGSLWIQHGVERPGQALLDSVFQTVSITTTTGYGTADFDKWPNLPRLLMVMLMFVGGCAGSTAGGMKVMRVVIGIKASFREVRMMFSPNSVLAVFVGKAPVPAAVVSSVVGFLFLYVLIWALGTVTLTVGNTDLESAASAAIATLGNIGPGLRLVGPVENFAFWAGWQKLVMVLLMWLGRLEVYPIAALVALSFWRR